MKAFNVEYYLFSYRWVISDVPFRGMVAKDSLTLTLTLTLIGGMVVKDSAEMNSFYKQSKPRFLLATAKAHNPNPNPNPNPSHNPNDALQTSRLVFRSCSNFSLGNSRQN